MFKHQKQLVMVISVLLIVGFLLATLSSYFISINSLRDQIVHNQLPLTSDNIYSEIQRDLLRPVFISSLMASDTFLRDWVLQGEKDVDEITRYLNEIKTRYNAYTAFFVSDKSRNYYHVDGVLKQVDAAQQRDQWYFRVKRISEPYEINVDIDMANNDALTVFVNYRVFDYEGRFIGATGVGLSVESVVSIINRYKQTYLRDILFVDSNGLLKFSSASQEKPGNDVAPLIEALQTDALMQLIRSDDTQSFDFNAHSQTLLVNTRYIEEFGWYLLVVQSELEGSDKLLRTLIINLAVCALITIIVLVIVQRIIKSYQAQLEKLATTDKLTGLNNRLAFDMLFRHVLSEQERHPVDLAVLMLDIDHFKTINDAHGHLVGDEVLRHLAVLLSNRMRASDIVTRWGGEEFIVLAMHCDLEKARNMAEEIRLAVMNNPYSGKDSGLDMAFTVSIGVTQHRAGDGHNQLLGRVDKALYKAKKGGRNRVEVI